jgi:hypothetical protein
MTFFYCLTEYHPDFDSVIKDNFTGKKIAAFQDRITNMHKQKKTAAELWKKFVKYQVKHYNRTHMHWTYAVEDQVHFNTKNFRTKKPHKKLDNKFMWPFEVIEHIGKQTYKLQLTPMYKALHPVFHISLLEPYMERPRTGSHRFYLYYWKITMNIS